MNMETVGSFPNSVIFVYDPTAAIVIPDEVGGALVKSTDTCISVGTLAEMDGKTKIILSDEIGHPTGTLIYSGRLSTPGKMLAVGDSVGQSIIEMNVMNFNVNVSIWVNHPSEPDNILIQAQ